MVKGRLKTYNGALSNMKEVVSQVTKPGGKIGCYSEAELDLVPVHSKGLLDSVTYFGTEEQLSKIEDMVSKEGCFLIARGTEEVLNETQGDIVKDNENNDVSTVM